MNDLKVSSPEAGIRPRKTCTFPMEIAKHRDQSFRMKLRNAELYLKGATVISGYLRLAAACSKIARTSFKVGKTRLLPRVLLRSSFQLITCRVRVNAKLLRFHITRALIG